MGRVEVRCELKTGVLELGWIIFRGQVFSRYRCGPLAFWRSEVETREVAPGFPAGRALGAVVRSGKAAGACGSVALPPRQVCFLLAFSAEPGGRVLLRGGEGRGGWAPGPPNPSQAHAPSPQFTNVFPLRGCVSRCVASLGLKRLAGFQQLSEMAVRGRDLGFS